MKKYELFGKTLRGFRHDKSMSSTGLARLVGGKCGASAISQYENGRRPGKGRLLAICKALGLDENEISDLLNLTDYGPIAPVDVNHPVLRASAEAIGEVVDPTMSDVLLGTDRDAEAFLQGWQGYLRAKKGHYRRKWVEAIESCDDAYSKIVAASVRMRVLLLDTKATAKLHLGLIGDAEVLYNEAEQVLGAGDEFLKAVIATHQGDVNRARSDWSKALTKYHDALDVFSKGDPLKIAWVARKIGLTHLFKGDWDEAERALERSELICQDLCDHNQVATYEFAKTSLALGWVHSVRGEWLRAVALRKRGLELARRFRITGNGSDDYLILQGLLYSGIDSTQIDDYDTAEQYLTEALRLSGKLEEKKERGMILLGLARLYHAMGPSHWEKAQSAFDDALTEHARVQDRHRQAVTLLHLSKFLMSHGDIAKALNTAKESLGRFHDLSNAYYETEARVQLGRVLYCQKRFDEINDLTEKIEKESKREAHQYNQHLARFRAVQASAEMSQGKGHAESAISCCAEAFDYAVRYNEYLVRYVEGEIDHEVLMKVQREQSLATASEVCAEIADQFWKTWISETQFSPCTKQQRDEAEQLRDRLGQKAKELSDHRFKPISQLVSERKRWV